MVFETGGPAVHSGLVMRGLPGVAGRIHPSNCATLASEADDLQPASVVVLENTHRSAGGRVWPLEELREVAATAREAGMGVHLDGARLMNASVASGVPAAEYGRLADSVTVCFSKGLGCPLGAVIATSEERIAEAWRGKFLFGGAMRQAGIVAAAALYALDHHVEGSPRTTRRARVLAEALAAAGLAVDPDATETNFVAIDVRPLGLDTREAAAPDRRAGRARDRAAAGRAACGHVPRDHRRGRRPGRRGDPARARGPCPRLRGRGASRPPRTRGAGAERLPSVAAALVATASPRWSSAVGLADVGRGEGGDPGDPLPRRLDHEDVHRRLGHAAARRRRPRARRPDRRPRDGRAARRA